MVNKQVEIKIIRKVAGNSSGTINVPRFLIGKEVEITFIRELTEKEQKELELNNLHHELKKLKEKK